MTYQKPQDPCPKCEMGTYKNLKYVRSAGEGFPRDGCFGCPAEEHLHMSCDVCGYTVLGQTVPEAQAQAAREKAAEEAAKAAPPDPPPPPVEPPPEAATASAHSDTGFLRRGKK